MNVPVNFDTRSSWLYSSVGISDNLAKASDLKRVISNIHNSTDRVDGRKVDSFQLSTKRLIASFGQALLPLFRCLPGVDTKIAVDEANHHFKTVYPQLLNELSNQRQEIIEQLQAEGAYDGDINKITAAFDALSFSFKSGCASPGLLRKIVQYQHDKSACKSVKIERDASVLNIIGIGGNVLNKCIFLTNKIMTQITSLTSSGAAASTVLAAGKVLSTVSNAVIIPVQLALIGRDAMHAAKARKQNQQIYTDKTTLDVFKEINERKNRQQDHSEVQESVGYLNDEAVRAAQELLSRKRHYNQHLIAASAAGSLSGGVSVAGGICALTGVGFFIGFALSGISLAIGVGAGIQRAIYKGKESTFLGLAASNNAQQIISDHSSVIVGVNGLEKTVRDSAELMNRYQMMVAESKLDSLIQQVIDKNRKNGATIDAATLRKQVEIKANKLVNRLIKGTTLLESDLNVMKKILAEKYDLNFFTGDIETLQLKLNDKLQSMMDNVGLQISDDTLQRIHRESSEELWYLHSRDPVIKSAFMTATGKKKKVLTGEELKQLCSGSESGNSNASAVYNRIYSRHLVQQLKIDSKFLRHHAGQNFINSVDAVVVAHSKQTV